ncbi:MAG: hypothetical protein A2148_08505 [Chloroflexi bacterium RBG_16_68_14]|nr:MAG: hypothetical protein A2148_08505 [Chloroflexi bacterium RBG_16_68_14]
MTKAKTKQKARKTVVKQSSNGKAPPTPEFNTDTVRKVVVRVEELLKPLEAEFGVRATSAPGGSYSGSCLTMKVDISFVGSDGVAATLLVQDFRRFASLHGLTPDALGREFTFQGKRYQITGLRVNARRFPIECLRSDGQRVAFPADNPAITQVAGSTPSSARRRQRARALAG